MEFHAKLRRLIKKRRYSHAAVAAELRCSRSAIGKWARGESKPDLDLAARLAAVLGVSLDYLADDAQDDPTPLLSDDERHILRIAKTMEADEAIRRLASPGWPGAGRPHPAAVAVRTGISGIEVGGAPAVPPRPGPVPSPPPHPAGARKKAPR
jgi:transcriptional regulator with XRE-family HTH domain